MKNNYILHILCISSIQVLMLAGCSGKNDVQVDYDVLITKEVDSLPCRAEVIYTDYGSEANYEHKGPITDNWHCTKLCYYDTQVDLTATGISNVKTITVKITARKSTVVDTCNGTSCTASTAKKLYQD